MEQEFNIRARQEPIGFGGDYIQLFAYQTGEGGYYAANKLEMVQQPHEYEIPVMTTIDKSQAQVLMDDLYAAGIRPSEGAGSAGAMAAVQNHLKDLRTILFHTMSIK